MLFKYSGKYVNIYFNMKITFFKDYSMHLTKIGNSFVLFSCKSL